MKSYLIFFSLFFSLLPFSFAYIDPGTGGIIIQQSGGVIASIFAVIIGFLATYFWKPLKKFVLKLRNITCKK